MSGLEPALLEHVVDAICSLEADAVAVIVIGSYAKGEATPGSDLDLRAVTRRAPTAPYRMWFEERRGPRPLHVSLGAKSVDDWLAARRLPVGWSLGLPARYDACYLWAIPEAVDALGDPPSSVHPAGAPELEDFFEAVLKVGRAAGRDDEIAARLHARSAAGFAPRLLLPLNGERIVRDRRDAVAAAAAMAVAPAGYAEDFLRCYGLEQATLQPLAASARRLGEGLLRFLRERCPDVDDAPGVERYLRDGTLERLVRLEYAQLE